MPRVKEPNYFALRAMGVNLSDIPENARALWGNAVSDTVQYRGLFAAESKREQERGLDPSAAAEITEHPSAEVLAFGECSPVYLPVAGTAQEIHASIPDARLIAVLRDPVDRAISHHAHNLGTGMETEAQFARAVVADEAKGIHSEYVRQSCYAMLLNPYFRLFPRNQVLLLDYAELAKDAPAFMDRVFDHIGVDKGVQLQVGNRTTKSSPAFVAPADRARLGEKLRPDTHELADRFDYEPARAWSSY